MPVIRDPDAIRAILTTDPVWSVYALGDLAPGLFARCSWFTAQAGSPALALLYRGFTPPVLFTLGEPAVIATLLDELAGEPVFYLQVRQEIVPVLEPRYRLTNLKNMWRMVLEPSRFHAAPGEVTRLSAADFAHIERLYSDGHITGEIPDFFFASMLDDGVFWGVREGEELVAVAGTHLVVPQEGVAAVGNVYTRRDRRGRGLAARATSAVVSELLRMGLGTIALNVNQQNLPAMRAYERLGFTLYCEFIEGRAEPRQ